MKRQGLTTEEATQLLQRYGENKLVEAKKESLLKKIGKQLLDVLMLILLIGAIVSYMRRNDGRIYYFNRSRFKYYNQFSPRI